MAEVEASPLVLVTGASGFIATHAIQQLQQAGYRVRGTVRSLSNETKVKPLYDLCPDAKHKLELVEADLTSEECWDPAVKDCTYVLHIASPFNLNPANEDEVIKPAVEGTLFVLKACQKARVKRVVLTSSCTAICGGMVGDDSTKTYSEEDWADSDMIQQAYDKSKVLAEKAAWDFHKELPEEERFELVAMNPIYVLGPVLCGGDASSMELLKQLLERKTPMLPRLYFAIVDVRDVAEAHIKALTNNSAVGHRHILCAGGMWLKDLAQLVSREFKPQGYNVPTMTVPNFAIWVRSIFDKTAKYILPSLGKSVTFDTTRMRDVLGVTPRELETTIIDMAYSLIEKGFVKKAKKYTGPKKEDGEIGTEGEKETEEDKKINGDAKEAIKEENQEATQEGATENKTAKNKETTQEGTTEENKEATQEGATEESKEATQEGATEEKKEEDQAEKGEGDQKEAEK